MKTHLSERTKVLAFSYDTGWRYRIPFQASHYADLGVMHQQGTPLANCPGRALEEPYRQFQTATHPCSVSFHQETAPQNQSASGHKLPRQSSRSHGVRLGYASLFSLCATCAVRRGSVLV